ncbi:MAG: ATP-binding protein, partial [Rhizobiaceae bacterium]
DDGPGFSSDILDKIGEPYATSRSSVARNGGGGLGLGLFIAKTLLERSGAWLAIRNREGRQNGADIQVQWPRSQMEQPQQDQFAAQTLTNARERANSLQPKTAAKTMQPGKT